MISNKKIKYQNLPRIKVFFSDVDGTLTDGCTYYSEHGEEMKKFNHKDGRGTYLLRQLGIKFGIITGENSKIVESRAKKIKANYCFLGVDDKLNFFKSFCEKEKLSLMEIAFIGDDTNDLDIIKNVGLSFAVNDSVPLIKKAVHFICERNGGDGAFREAADFLIDIEKNV